MPSKVQIKRSAVPGKIPTTTQLDLGELAINVRDGKLFLKRQNANGTFTIVEVGSPDAVAASLNLQALAYVNLGPWTLRNDNGTLTFAHNGVDRMSLTSQGNLIVSGDITAFGAP